MSKNIPVYTVDSGVPPPDAKHVPLESLEVGDSMLFPLARRNTVQTLASRIKSKSGKEFTIKKIDENTARIWRLQ